MSSSYASFDTQKQQDATFTIKSMGTQLGINAGIAVVVLLGFGFLRPKWEMVYAPKLKCPTKNRPPPINAEGWFAWIKVIMTIPDEDLREKIGCDAMFYITFVCMLRKLILAMTIFGIIVLIPINIVATKNTGTWPPPAGSISALSLAGINEINGELRPDPIISWYFAPFIGTYVFTIFIFYFVYCTTSYYIELRQYYFRLSENQEMMKTLMVSHLPEDIKTDEELKLWFIINQNGVKYPASEAMIGHSSSKLSEAYKEYETTVEKLEAAQIWHEDTDKRPTIRVGRKLCCGGELKDAIDHYKEKVEKLTNEISRLRKKSKKPASYGWVTFEEVELAHSTARLLSKTARVKLSPTPKNLVWGNLSVKESKRYTKQWIGRIIYVVFVFAWMLPMSLLSATSNVINLIRLFPNSSNFINSHSKLITFVQSFFAPAIMAGFFYFLPRVFRFMSKQQGYWTETTLDRKAFVKLYGFFIVNNLLVFTLTSTFISIYGQIRALIISGTLPADASLSNYVTQIAKNLSDVSNYWINFVCLKSLGLTMELAMVAPLLINAGKRIIRHSQKDKFSESDKPPEFEYSQNYNLLLFFFTITLVYSVMSPLILPFALVYFCVANIVYKYLLMYIYETKIESGGKIWPALFQTIMFSTIFFQVTMIIILILKGGNLQAYGLIPLPVFTLSFYYVSYKRIREYGSYISTSYKLTGEEDVLKYRPYKVITRKNTTEKDMTKHKLLKNQFRDPAYYDKLTNSSNCENESSSNNSGSYTNEHK